MGEKILVLLFIVFFLTIQTVNGQNADTINFIESGTTKILDVDTINETIFVEKSDTIIPAIPDIDDNISDIISGQIDSLENSWPINNSFLLDSSEVNLSKSYLEMDCLL